MALTQVQNNPAIDLLAFYPSGIGTSLNAVYTSCDPVNGNFFSATGRDLVTFIGLPASAAPAWSPTVIYSGSTIGGHLFGSVVNFSQSATITNVAVTSNVLTVTAVNTFQVGDPITFSSVGTATFLNGVTVNVATIIGGGTGFTASFTHIDYASAPDTGTAATPTAAFQATASSTNVHPTSTAGASVWTSYTSGTDVVNVTSAPDGCTGRTANIVNYAVPVFDTTKTNVEFLILPSSTFTQASGQVQFQASSNLVTVYVRNL
jgi:hypothetical protein